MTVGTAAAFPEVKSVGYGSDDVPEPEHPFASRGSAAHAGRIDSGKLTLQLGDLGSRRMSRLGLLERPGEGLLFAESCKHFSSGMDQERPSFR
jgi:hypothetical protein